MYERSRWPLLLGVVAVHLLMACIYLFLGELNEDEGWYLLASLRVMAGARPYLDFAYTQSPVLPYVYGPVQVLLGQGVLVGRITSLILETSAMLMCMSVAWRLAGGRAALVVALAWGLNPYLAYFAVVVKTYPLTLFFTSAALFVLLGRPQVPWRAGVAAALLALAAGTRLSAMAALPALWLLSARRRTLRPAMACALTVLALVFLPFALQEPGNTWWNLLGYHISRYRGLEPLYALWLKLHALWVTLRVFVFPVGAMLLLRAAVGAGQLTVLARSSWAHKPEQDFLWGALVLVFLSHFIPGGAFEDYQVIVLPYLSVLLALLLGRGMDGMAGPALRRFHGRLAGLLLLGALLCRGVNWLDMSGGSPPLAELEQVANSVRQHAGDGMLFTLHAPVAVQSGVEVYDGLEMGVFSYNPDTAPRRVHELHLLNDETVMEKLEDPRTTVVVLCESDFRFDGSHHPLDQEKQEGFRRQVLALLDGRFVRVLSLEKWGQFKEPVAVYSSVLR